jgi:hypothetical protein
VELAWGGQQLLRRLREGHDRGLVVVVMQVPAMVVVLLLLRRMRMGGLREGGATLDAVWVVGSSTSARHLVQGHDTQRKGAATANADAAAMSNAVATAGRGAVQSNWSNSSTGSRSRDA